MIRNYLLLALRNLRRQPGTAFINLIGLSSGMAAAIILTLFVSHERSFENMHGNGDRVYRIITRFEGTFDRTIPYTLARTGPSIADVIPEVEAFSRIMTSNTTIYQDVNHFTNTRVFYVDSGFTDIFNFQPLEGNIHLPLRDPSHVILTERMAGNLFPGESALGKTIEMDVFGMDLEKDQFMFQRRALVVGAVIADPPTNTHLQFDVLAPLLAIPEYQLNGLMNFFATYFLLSSPPDRVLHETISSHAGELVAEVFGQNLKATILLQGLKDIHFGQRLDTDLSPPGNRQSIRIMIGLALFILVIAIFNFVNLVTARSDKRIIETGIRKVSGAGKKDIVLQFLGESVLFAFIALAVALILVEAFLPPFSALLERDLSLYAFFSLSLVGGLLMLALGVGIAAGLYPAIHFAGHQPAAILKGQLHMGRKTALPRVILVVMQFAMVVLLIVSLRVVNDQVRFMKRDDLGYDKENVLLFRSLTPGIQSSYQVLKQSLLQLPEVTAVTASQAVPGLGGAGQVFRLREQTPDQGIPITYFATIDDFIDFYDIPLLEGRWLDERIQTDRYEFVVNQETVRRLGLDEPIGADVAIWEYYGKIIGVVKDFHYQSLHQPIGALVFNRYFDEIRIISVKVAADDLPAARARIEQVFMQADASYGVSSVWLDEIHARSYRFEDRNFSIILFASIVAIVIALLGLIGLSSYMVRSRQREIGLRKVLGASGFQVIMVFINQILRWISIAIVIALPLAWWIATTWLENFAYRIRLSPWLFIVAALITVVAVSITVFSQAWHAVSRSPAKTLKTG